MPEVPTPEPGARKPDFTPLIVWAVVAAVVAALLVGFGGAPLWLAGGLGIMAGAGAVGAMK